MTESQHILNNQAIIMAALASLVSSDRMQDALLRQARIVEEYFEKILAEEMRKAGIA